MKFGGIMFADRTDSETKGILFGFGLTLLIGIPWIVGAWEICKWAVLLFS